MTEREVMQLVRERMGSQSQQDAARMFGVAHGYFSQMFRGKCGPSKQLMKAQGLVKVVEYRRIAEVQEQTKSEATEVAQATKRKRLFRYGDWPVFKVGR